MSLLGGGAGLCRVFCLEFPSQRAHAAPTQPRRKTTVEFPGEHSKIRI